MLYVDDEQNPLIITKRFLENVDNEIIVNVLSSPKEALKIYDSYDCIISDYKMPIMNGLDFALGALNWEGDFFLDL